ncbi:MAG: hypothetical protein AAFO03_20700 [Bacteroidota bacterium]
MLQRIKKDLVNLPGWRTKKKIVVIESDDWGTVALRSKEALEDLLEAGLPIPGHAFARYDCLESNTDLEELFGVLSKYKDKNGAPPCITSCSLVANPDFEKVKASGFTEYHYEPFTETYKRYPDHDRAYELVKKGIAEGYFYPQLHGREHLNPAEWLRVLQRGDEQELLLFEKQTLVGLPAKGGSKRFNGYFGAFDYEAEQEIQELAAVIQEGQQLFEQLFGFKSKTFVAPTGIRSDKIDPYLMEQGVLYHQLGQQFLPYKEARYAIRQRFLGSKNGLGQIYWRRNGFFEPARDRQRNWVGQALNDLQSAFRMSKPFILSTHRVNYVGGIDPTNREYCLKQLDELLRRMLQAHPDIVFMNSEQLGTEIQNNPSYFLGLSLKDFYYDQKFVPN